MTDAGRLTYTDINCTCTTYLLLSHSLVGAETKKMAHSGQIIVFQDCFTYSDSRHLIAAVAVIHSVNCEAVTGWVMLNTKWETFFWRLMEVISSERKNVIWVWHTYVFWNVTASGVHVVPAKRTNNRQECQVRACDIALGETDRQKSIACTDPQALQNRATGKPSKEHLPLWAQFFMLLS